MVRLTRDISIDDRVPVGPPRLRTQIAKFDVAGNNVSWNEESDSWLEHETNDVLGKWSKMISTPRCHLRITHKLASNGGSRLVPECRPVDAGSWRVLANFTRDGVVNESGSFSNPFLAEVVVALFERHGCKREVM